MNSTEKNMEMAERGAFYSIVTYIVIATIKTFSGILLNASSLVADGLNNFTDVISSVAIFIGLKSARLPADDDHRYGHWKAESIASLATSFIMFFVAIGVLRESIFSFFSVSESEPDISAAGISFLTGLVLLALYQYNHQLAIKTDSQGLAAAAADNRADVLTSIATGIAIIGAYFGLTWLDQVMALIVGLIILKSAYDIFKENVFDLSDGFDEEKLEDYSQTVSEVDGIIEVRSIRGRLYGNRIYLDLTIIVEDDMTVYQSHQLADEIEEVLRRKHQISHSHIHIEPLSEIIH